MGDHCLPASTSRQVQTVATEKQARKRQRVGMHYRGEVRMAAAVGPKYHNHIPNSHAVCIYFLLIATVTQQHMRTGILFILE